ncbi:hypothetical protein REBECCA_220 [Erwinia phage Rebecca]|uniref:Uncharacterized protein n=2 Tax=Agricanvirus TaxID=1984776 RepID=A0A482ID51_9CAUD|nr:hypothetical protein MADMEL_220 [Erwinia phage vB_EamM_MadMel]QBP07325.1 hypothetical protein REBECCA_220 [Erwinia phage Rebecca]
MVIIDRNPEFEHIVDAIKHLIDPDAPDGVSVKSINDVIDDLRHHYHMRSNIVDMDPDIAALHEPFYVALNNLLIRYGFQEDQIINFIISDKHANFVLITT